MKDLSIYQPLRDALLQFCQAQGILAQSHEQALLALSCLQDGLPEWPDCIPVNRAQAEMMLTGPFAQKYINRNEKTDETELHARVRCFYERILLEGLKRQLLWKFAKVFSAEDSIRLKRAEDFGHDAHLGQYRDSGEPYFVHPLAVADIVLDMDMDADAVICAILHDTVEDNDHLCIEMVSDQFGIAVASLVDGVTKLTKASDQGIITKEQQQAESVRKMLLAMAKDIRVIPIKLADRLHNMRTLEYCKSDKRIRKAKETLEIYAPLAHRLGMGQIKCELEDLAFAEIDPQKYAELAQMLQRLNVERGAFIKEAMSIIQMRLNENQIEATIHGRPKHIYSIYKKLTNQGIAFEEVYDLMAIRVLVSTVAECYTVLGMMHQIWHPIPLRFKDYISTPKPNGYKSLHTTLAGDNGIPFEVQIRTKQMHSTAEYGIAAHWKYKEGRTTNSDLDVTLNWVRQLMNDKIEDSDEFMRVLKVDFFSDYVFVFTPQGEVIDLVTGSTPIDFAYRIHSAVGNKCVGAKVNGKLVPLDYELRMGDIVEIIKSSTLEGPRRDWLKIVKTQQARSKIKAWFKKELKTENIERGRSMLEIEARRQGLVLSAVLDDEKCAQMFRRLSILNLNDLYAAVGFGSVNTGQVIPRLVEDNKKIAQEVEAQHLLDVMKEKEQTRKRKNHLHNTVLVNGDDDMLVRFARCCAPVPGDQIVGYITQGRGVSVHRADCANLKSLFTDSQARAIEVQWSEEASTHREFTAHIQLVAFDRGGIMFEVSQLFMNLKIALSNINARVDKRGNTILTLQFDVKDAEQLVYIKKQLRTISGVIDVFRVQS